MKNLKLRTYLTDGFEKKHKKKITEAEGKLRISIILENNTVVLISFQASALPGFLIG